MVLKSKWEVFALGLDLNFPFSPIFLTGWPAEKLLLSIKCGWKNTFCLQHIHSQNIEGCTLGHTKKMYDMWIFSFPHRHPEADPIPLGGDSSCKVAKYPSWYQVSGVSWFKVIHTLCISRCPAVLPEKFAAAWNQQHEIRFYFIFMKLVIPSEPNCVQLLVFPRGSVRMNCWRESMG